MEKERIKLKVKDYIFQNAGEEVGDAIDIFEQRAVNSLFAIALMSFIEKEFKVKFTMEDMHWDRLRSVEAIADFVLRKRREG